MSRFFALAAAAVLAATPALARSKKKSADGGEKKSAKSALFINGERAVVNWSDGDSFKILEGPYAGSGTRLVGYNTLESYGPVHRWGQWTAQELYEIAKTSKHLGASREWNCKSDGKLDGYRRVLIDCPDAAKEFIRQGHGMAYAIEGMKADPELLAAQREAQEKKAGIWAKGVPNGIVTSLHAVGEEGGQGDTAYNRVLDTRTGDALKRKHKDRYETCQEVCVETDGNSSCMVFVPFQNRYKNRAECLKSAAAEPEAN